MQHNFVTAAIILADECASGIAVWLRFYRGIERLMDDNFDEPKEVVDLRRIFGMPDELRLFAAWRLDQSKTPIKQDPAS